MLSHLSLSNGNLTHPVGLFLGPDGYQIYKDMHQDPVNRFIHGVGMPFVVVGVWLMTAILPFVRSRKDLWLANLVLTTSYGIYYAAAKVAPVAWIFSCDIFYTILLSLLHIYYVAGNMRWENEWKAKINADAKARYFMNGLYMFCISLFVLQEGIGHTFFEKQNSNIWVLPTSIVISPLFGFRALFLSV